MLLESLAEGAKTRGGGTQRIKKDAEKAPFLLCVPLRLCVPANCAAKPRTPAN